MENNSPRVLAYSVSQEVSDDLLQLVVGGVSSSPGISYGPTCRPTGMLSVDMAFDLHGEW